MSKPSAFYANNGFQEVGYGREKNRHFVYDVANGKLGARAQAEDGATCVLAGNVQFTVNIFAKCPPRVGKVA